MWRFQISKYEGFAGVRIDPGAGQDVVWTATLPLRLEGVLSGVASKYVVTLITAIAVDI